MNMRSGYAALVGRPNVGKSTLLNCMLGQKMAITSHKPQTTRHRILGVNTLPNCQIVYVDTPGIHLRGEKAMNRYLNRTAQTALMDVDLVLLVCEALIWTEEDEQVLNSIKDAKIPCVAVVNKVDTVKPKELLLPYLAKVAAMHDFVEVMPVSARKSINSDALEKIVIDNLPEGELIYPEDQITDRSERFFASELLREQITRRYHKELPYAVTVEIEQFKEEEDGRYVILAVVWVERSSQRSILLGKGGAAMKETATAARKQMINFFQTKVHLEVWIKVKKSWSSNEANLNQLGYSE